MNSTSIGSEAVCYYPVSYLGRIVQFPLYTKGNPCQLESTGDKVYQYCLLCGNQQLSDAQFAAVPESILGGGFLTLCPSEECAKVTRIIWASSHFNPLCRSTIDLLNGK